MISGEQQNEGASRPANREALDNGTLAMLAGLGILGLMFFVNRLVLAAQPFSLNYNEGWNAYHALRFAETGSPYPPAGGLTMNNYPPLWFPVVALIAHITKSYMFAARAVATAGLISILITVGLTCQCLRGRHGFIVGVVVSGFFLVTQATSYVGIADPQFFAQGVSAIAIVLSARAKCTGDRTYLLAVIVAVLAGFIKHNLLALPAALVIASMFDGMRSFARVAAAATTALVAGYLVSAAVGGFGWPVNLHSARVYFYGNVVNKSVPFLTSNSIGLALALFGFSTLTTSHVKRVLNLYLVFALLVGMVFSGGYGVGINMFFEVMVATAVGTSLAVLSPPLFLSTRTSSSVRPLPRWFVGAAVTGWLFGGSLYSLRDLVHSRNDSLPLRREQYQADVNFLKGINGDVFCQEIALCYFAGKPFIYDPFNANQALVTGELTPAKVRELLGGRVQAFQVGDTTTVVGGLPSPLADEIAKEFVPIASRMNGTFLVRRSLVVPR